MKLCWQKTAFRSVDVPVVVYDGYGLVGGVQWAWNAFILPWHAVASVSLPIAFTHRAFPDSAKTTWLGRKTTLVIATILAVLISVFFLLEDTTGLPLMTYFAAVLFWIAAYGFMIRPFAHVDHPAIGWFRLGWYVQVAMLSWLGLALQNPLLVLVHMVVMALLLWFLRRTEPNATQTG